MLTRIEREYIGYCQQFEDMYERWGREKINTMARSLMARGLLEEERGLLLVTDKGLAAVAENS